MSNWIYLECLNHDPPLTADEESGQHLYDLQQLRNDIANRERIQANAADGIWPTDYYRINTARFLAAHPKCDLGIRDETGNAHPLVEPTEPVNTTADDNKHEAAALWGAAENPAFPMQQRLAAALRALELIFPEGNE